MDAPLTVRLANRQDDEAVVAFLRQHWQATHSLVHSDALRAWQHGSPLPGEDRLHWVVAHPPQAPTALQGLLGYIPTYQWDATLANAIPGGPDLWLAIWKVADTAASGALGLRLLSVLTQQLAPRSIGAIGVNPAVLPIYKALGYTTGQLTQLYWANPASQPYRVLQGTILPPAPPAQSTGRAATLTALPWDAAAEALAPLDQYLKQQLPAKSAAYWCQRYGQHPVYSYALYQVKAEVGSLCLVVRAAEANGRLLLRLVDWAGDDAVWSQAAPALGQLLSRYPGAEALDTYVDDQQAACLSAAGWQCRTGTPAIIPNYFEPFEARTVELPYVYKCLQPHDDSLTYRMIKGDSDQDRPSHITV